MSPSSLLEILLMDEVGFGNAFHPTAQFITCTKLLSYIPYGTERNVNHERQGKLLRRAGSKYKIPQPINICGLPLRPAAKRESPITERSRKLRSFCRENGSDTIKCTGPNAEYPAWRNQHRNILTKACSGDLGACPKFEKEITQLWMEWSLQTEIDYRTGKKESYPQYRGVPPWRSRLPKPASTISSQRRITTRITSEFYSKYRSRALFDCEEFFRCETARSSQSFKDELEKFVKKAKQSLAVEWPLSVGRIMLDEGETWIPLIVDGSCRTYFEAVAAVQSRLLYSVIVENIDRVQRCFEQRSSQPLLSVELENEDEPYDLNGMTIIFHELAKIPRVEHKLYPKHFEATTIDISEWLRTHSVQLDMREKSIPTPLMALTKNLIILEQAVEELCKTEEYDVETWKSLIIKVRSIRNQVFCVRRELRVGPILYERKKKKNVLLRQVDELLMKIRTLCIDRQSTKNDSIRKLFTECSRKIYGADILTQLKNIAFVQEKLPLLKQQVAETHLVYAGFLEHFTLTDSELRHYWEISRLAFKLQHLTNYVWEKIQREREWITKKVSAQSSAHYYEAELIDREYESTLRKYEIAISPQDIRRVGTKLKQLEERTRLVKMEEQEISGQRAILELAPFSVDINRLLQHTDYFAELAQLHYDVMSHEDTVLTAHVMDVNYEEVTTRTATLISTSESVASKREFVEEIYRSLVDSTLKKISGVLCQFSTILPVLSALHNQGMKEKHWQEIIRQVEPGVEIQGNPKVCDLLKMNLTEKAVKFEEISSLAEKEMQLEDSIEQMRKQWEQVKFDSHQPGSLMSTELTAQITAHIAKSQHILSSPYAYTIMTSLKSWLDTLVQLNTFIELHKQCMEKWHRIEGVFANEDIAYQMPTEFRIFKKISTNWETVNKRIIDDRPILEQIEAVTELNALLSEMKQDFECLEKGFHAYLKKKRVTFPRFYLLSDTQLLDLLSRSREPVQVTPYIPRLFAGISSLQFNSRGEVSAVYLNDNVVTLSSAVNVNIAKRHVEKWLNELDRELKATVRNRVKVCLERHLFEVVGVANLLEELEQVVVLFYRIVLTHQIETALRQNRVKDVLNLLEQNIQECKQLLKEDHPRAELIVLVGRLLIRYSELLHTLISHQTVFLDDKLWTSQVRYYWHLDHVFVRVHGISVRYDYDMMPTTGYPDSAMEDSIGSLFVWNHFGVGPQLLFSSENGRSLISTAAQALGRTTVTIDPLADGMEELLQGALLMGCILSIDNENSIINKINEGVRYTVSTAANLKFTIENEITINTSFLPMKHCESSSSMRNWQPSHSNASTTTRQHLTLYEFSEVERCVNRLNCIISTLTELFTDFTLSDSLLNTVLGESVRMKRQEGVSEIIAVDTAVTRLALTGLNLEDWDSVSMLVSEALRLKPVDDRESVCMRRKIEELTNLLRDHFVIIIKGDCLSEKSALIKKALELTERVESTEIEKREAPCRMEELQQIIEEIGHGSKYAALCIDGCGDEAVIQWLNELIQPATLHASNFPILPMNPNLRILVETDTVPVALRHHPTVIMEAEGVLDFPSNLSLSQLSLLSTVLSRFNLLPITKQLMRLRIDTLCRHFTDMDDVIFDHILFLILNGQLSYEKATDIYEELETSIPLTSIYDTFPTKTDVIDLVEQEKLHRTPRGVLYVIRWAEVLLRLNCIPMVYGAHTMNRDILLEKMTDYLHKTTWQVTRISINASTSYSEFSRLLRTCRTMFGDDKHVDYSTVVMLGGFEQACAEIVEFVRFNQKSNNPIKFLLVSSHPPSFYPKRLQRFIFSLPQNMVNTSEEQLYPRATYDHVITAVTRKITRKEKNQQGIRRAFHTSLQRASQCEEYQSIRSSLTLENGLNSEDDLSEILNTYERYVADTNAKSGFYPIDGDVLTTQLAAKMKFMETVLSVAGSNMLVVGKANTSYWMQLISERSHLQLEQFEGDQDMNDWNTTLNRVLNDCLLEQKPTVLLISLRDLSEAVSQLVLDDIHTVTVHNSCPPKFLTQHFLSEFSEQFTLEGNLIWEKLTEQLYATLHVCITVSETQLRKLRDTRREIVNMSILVWPEEQTQESEETILRKILREQNILANEELLIIEEKLRHLRKNVTAPDYFRIARTFVQLVRTKKKIINSTMLRYEKGMEKLRLAQEQTGSLQAELERLQPELLRTSIETSILMSSIERETIEVENAREVVAANENKANQAATRAQALKAESEADLASAIPALEAAVDSLETMNQSDVSTLKTMRFPPYGVRLCMEAVCILLGEPPAKIPDPMGGITEDYWVTGQKLLSDLHFLSRIRAFPRDQVSRRTMRIIRENFLSKEEFDPESVKQCSLAAEGLCLWVKAIELYHRISKIVEPKRQKLHKAEVLVKQHMKQLEVKRKALQKVTERLQSLSDQFSQMSQRKQELQSRISSCEARRARAERLVAALGGEKDKWISKMNDIRRQAALLPQTCLMTATALRIYGQVPQADRKAKVRNVELQLFPDTVEFTCVNNKEIVEPTLYPIQLEKDQERSEQLIADLFPTVLRVTRTDDVMERGRLAMEQGIPLVASPSPELKLLTGLKMYTKNGNTIARLNDDEFPVNPGYRLIVCCSPSDDDDIMDDVIRINMEYCCDEIRTLVAASLGTQNWALHLTQHTEKQRKIEQDTKLLEQMESDMLEMLGRREELDDERAVESLAETHAIQNRLETIREESLTVAENLNQVVDRFKVLIDWTSNVVVLINRFSQINPYYTVSIEQLIDVSDTKLVEDVDEVKSEDMSVLCARVSEQFWTAVLGLLTDEHKRVLRHILDNRLFINTFDRLNFKEFERKSKNGGSENQVAKLATFIRQTDCRTPVVVVYERTNVDWTRHVRDMARKARVHYLSLIAKTKEMIVKLFADRNWIILSLDWEELKSLQFEEILDQHSEQAVDPEFRLIISLRGVENATKSVCRFGRRFCLSGTLSLSRIVVTSLQLSSTRNVFDTFSPARREQFLRLIVFHFAVSLRWRSRNVFDDFDLHMLLRLYIDHLQVLDDLASGPPADLLFSGVVQPLYCSQVKGQYEKQLVATIYNWIFEGVSRSDDLLLKRILGKEWDPESFVNNLRGGEVSLLSGLHSNVLAREKTVENTKLFDTLKMVLGAPAAVPDQGTIQPDGPERDPEIGIPTKEAGFSIRNTVIDELATAVNRKETERCLYLQSILAEERIDSINVDSIENPRRLLAVLRAEYATKHRIALEEVEIRASLPSPRQVAESNSLNRVFTVKECVLYGARIDNGELKELISGQPYCQPVSINLTVSKVSVHSSSTTKAIPLLDQNGDTVCMVKLRTSFPMAHWTLRGSHFRTRLREGEFY